MRAVLAVIVLTAACGSGSPSGKRSPTNGYCPSIGGAWRWRAELFAACPIPAFAIDLPVCDGPCPRPCAASGTTNATDPWSGTFSYDAAGHWTGSAFEGVPRETCVWKGDRLDQCTSPLGPPDRALRDAAGRLTSLDVGFDVPVLRNPAGQVTAVGDRTFTYDGAGRLATVHDEARDDTTEIRYDRLGRVAGTHDRRYETAWRYDAAGRLIGVDQDPHGHRDGSMRHRTELRYDDQHRLESIEETGPEDTGRSSTTYRYSCP